MSELLLEIADDELILGWRDSEWTGIAPFLEEDVAFSSIAQNEIGHARALYELAARELGTDADTLAFDRSPDEAFAEIYAREQYGRRQESVALWLVPRNALHEIDEFPDEFGMKYRRVDGYSIKARLAEARVRAGTLDMAPGAQSE